MRSTRVFAHHVAQKFTLRPSDLSLSTIPSLTPSSTADQAIEQEAFALSRARTFRPRATFGLACQSLQPLGIGRARDLGAQLGSNDWESLRAADRMVRQSAGGG
jgi:hypothetical protein